MSTGRTQSCFRSCSRRYSAVIGSETISMSTRASAPEFDEFGDGAELARYPPTTGGERSSLRSSKMPQMRMSLSGSACSARMSSSAGWPPPTMTARRSRTAGVDPFADERGAEHAVRGEGEKAGDVPRGEPDAREFAAHLGEKDGDADQAEGEGPGDEHATELGAGVAERRDRVGPRGLHHDDIDGRAADDRHGVAERAGLGCSDIDAADEVADHDAKNELSESRGAGKHDRRQRLAGKSGRRQAGLRTERDAAIVSRVRGRRTDDDIRFGDKSCRRDMLVHCRCRRSVALGVTGSWRARRSLRDRYADAAYLNEIVAAAESIRAPWLLRDRPLRSPTPSPPGRRTSGCARGGRRRPGSPSRVRRRGATFRAPGRPRSPGGTRRAGFGPENLGNAADPGGDKGNTGGDRLEHDIGHRFGARGDDKDPRQGECLPRRHAVAEGDGCGEAEFGDHCLIARLVGAAADDDRGRGPPAVYARCRRARR